FHSAWTGQADAAALLGVVAADPNAPAFARASALTELAPYVSPANINLARSALADPDPMVRIGALDMLANVSAAQIWPLVSPLLADSNRGVRIRAVALLAAVPTASQPPTDREPFERAAAEFVAAQRLNADRPERGPLWEISSRGAASCRMPRSNTGRHCCSAHNTGRRRSTSPIFIANSAGTGMEKGCCARRSPPHRRMRGRITRSASRSLG